MYVHSAVFNKARCWLCSFEWQKRGSPHAHILIWLVDKIQSEEIDKTIPAGIPDLNIDQELYEIVTANMIHGPCGATNMTAPCMDNGKCTKSFQKNCTNDTITNIVGYPLYRRRDTDDCGQLHQLRMSNSTNLTLTITG